MCQTACPHALQASTEDTPAHLSTWLDRKGLHWHKPCAGAGDAYPASEALADRIYAAWRRRWR
jgi:hypothetical protein